MLLLAVPFLAGTGEKSWKRRPVAVLGVILIVLTVTTLAGLGLRRAVVADMDAWSALPTPVAYVKGRTPLELQGALVIQNKQCRNCHSLGGEGGQRGPALDGVATRLTRDQLIRQVLQGGGNMPAYGKNLTPGRGERARGLHADAASRQPAASTALRRARRVGAVRTTAVHGPREDAR